MPQSPSTRWTSLWQMPQWLIRISTSWGPSGAGSYTNGLRALFFEWAAWAWKLIPPIYHRPARERAGRSNIARMPGISTLDPRRRRGARRRGRSRLLAPGVRPARRRRLPRRQFARCPAPPDRRATPRGHRARVGTGPHPELERERLDRPPGPGGRAPRAPDRGLGRRGGRRRLHLRQRLQAPGRGPSAAAGAARDPLRGDELPHRPLRRPGARGACSATSSCGSSRATGCAARSAATSRCSCSPTWTSAPARSTTWRA